MIMRMQITLLMMMTTKVDEPEGEEEIAGRLEQLRTLITDRFSLSDIQVLINRQTDFLQQTDGFSSTGRQVSSTQKKVKAFGFSGEKSSTQ